MLVSMLPGLLAYEKTPRGLGDLLSVAAGCAERCGTREVPPIAGPAATAGRKSASQTARQAARLLAAFPAGAEESTPEAVGPEAPGPDRKDQGVADPGI
ncbi:hypothetical protein EES46_28995 [Streptomyces sp. ADI98-10]|nr:hypothetical protein EES46_28995 [Streptomyces sp. ADI98-10]